MSVAPWSIRNVCDRSQVVDFKKLPAAVLCVYVSLPPCAIRRRTYSLMHFYNILHLLHLTSHTTFSEYEYAVRLGRMDVERLLPPEYPLITLRFVFKT